MIRIPYRLIAAGVLTATLAAGSALGQLRPPADVQQVPLPAPQQQPQQQQQPQPQPQQAPLPPPPQPKKAPVKEKKAPAKNQQKQNETKEQPAPNATPETMPQAPEGEHIANPTATFSGLDKISGRIIMFDVALNETVQFGALQVTPRACYTRPPTETQNTVAFVEVDEITLKAEIRRIFTGWMFANSPGLNAVEHPIYDIWLIDCKTTPPSITPSEGQQ